MYIYIHIPVTCPIKDQPFYLHLKVTSADFKGSFCFMMSNTDIPK